MITRRLLGPCVMVLALLRAAPVLAEGPESAYAQAWRDAQAAVGEFAVAQLRYARGPQRTAALKQAKDRYQAVLAQIERSPPPPSMTVLHWELLPLNEDLLAGMSTVVEGESSGDLVTIELGWTWIEQVRGQMRRTLRGELTGAR
ncbi:MAG TPA: hypothetical protein VEI82_08550 [Myxococcota bacterium]|nr:hypothetical protein [Myxococcota bacterium]